MEKKDIKKEILVKTILFIVIMAFISVFKIIFGVENVTVA